MNRQYVALWRRTLVLMAVACLATLMAAPSARADLGRYSCSFASDQPSFKGWATMSYRGCVEPGMAVTADCANTTAYRWTNAGWKGVTVGECSLGDLPTRVYVWPFGNGWSWVWSQPTGWLAVRSSKVLLSEGYKPSCDTCQ